MPPILGMEHAVRGHLPENKALLAPDAQLARAAAAHARTDEEQRALEVEGTLRSYDRNTARLRAGASHHAEADAKELAQRIAHRDANPNPRLLREKLAEMQSVTDAIAAMREED